MRAKGQYLLAASFWRSIGIILFLGYCFTITPAEAAVILQSFSGTVEVLFKGEHVWKPLSDTIKLDVGDQIRTSQDSSVDLVCEDGSELDLSENSQLAIRELEFSVAQKTCVSRFNLFWGAVTVKVAIFELEKNSFEIETNTAIITIKSSEGTVAASKDKSQSDVSVTQGLFDIQQIGNGIVNISGFVNDQEGIMFPLDTVSERVLLDIRRLEHKIILESNVSLPSIRALTGRHDGILEIKNAGEAPINVSFQGNFATLYQEEVATFEIPAEQEISLEATGKAHVIFWFGQVTFPDTQPSRERYSPRPAPKQTIESPILPE
jgi:hypothetical protein